MDYQQLQFSLVVNQKFSEQMERLFLNITQMTTNLSMVWIDYKKAYDVVPHLWIMECLNLMGVAEFGGGRGK